MACRDPGQTLAQLIHLALPPDEAGEAARGGGGIEPRALWASRHQLVDLNRSLQPFHRHRPEWPDLDVPLGESQ